MRSTTVQPKPPGPEPGVRDGQGVSKAEGAARNLGVIQHNFSQPGRVDPVSNGVCTHPLKSPECGPHGDLSRCASDQCTE